MTPPAGPLLVIGAGGFIGSWVTRAALDAGLETIAACLDDPWRLDDLPAGEVELLPVRDGRWHVPDEDAALSAAIGRAAAVALLAYTPPASGADRLEHERSVNRDGSVRIASLAATAGARLAFASSADVYGPWHEGPVTEDADSSPASPYGIAKLEAEEAIVAACPGAVSLRIATVFGPGENGPRAIPSFIRALAAGETPVIHGDGSDVRDYVYVADVAAAILAATAPGAGPAAINVGSGAGRSTLEVHDAVGRTMGRSAQPRHAPTERPPSRLVLDASTAARQLGWSPAMGFAEGLRREATWLMDLLARTGD